MTLHHTGLICENCSPDLKTSQCQDLEQHDFWWSMFCPQCLKVWCYSPVIFMLVFCFVFGLFFLTCWFLKGFGDWTTLLFLCFLYPLLFSVFLLCFPLPSPLLWIIFFPRRDLASIMCDMGMDLIPKQQAADLGGLKCGLFPFLYNCGRKGIVFVPVDFS